MYVGKEIIYGTIKIDFFELCFLPVSLSFPPFMMSYVLHRLGKILNFMWENGKKKKKKANQRVNSWFAYRASQFDYGRFRRPQVEDTEL